MSLVEFMVAAAIGLIATIVIFQVFAAFEGQKRTTMAGGEAQTNGTLALFTLERESRQAGYGINTQGARGAPTTTGPVWTLTADERRYRYKVFQTVVPVRNMIWRP